MLMFIVVHSFFSFMYWVCLFVLINTYGCSIRHNSARVEGVCEVTMGIFPKNTGSFCENIVQI